jgi:hypothetical protein
MDYKNKFGKDGVSCLVIFTIKETHMQENIFEINLTLNDAFGHLHPTSITFLINDFLPSVLTTL